MKRVTHWISSQGKQSLAEIIFNFQKSAGLIPLYTGWSIPTLGYDVIAMDVYSKAGQATSICDILSHIVKHIGLTFVAVYKGIMT